MHRECVGVARFASVQPTWSCPDCKVKQPRNNHDSTPVKGQETRISPPKTGNSNKVAGSAAVAALAPRKNFTPTVGATVASPTTVPGGSGSTTPTPSMSPGAVRPVTTCQGSGPSTTASSNATYKDEPEEETTLIKEMRAFRAEMNEAREEMKALRRDLQELRYVVDRCETRLDKLEEKVQKIEETKTSDEEVLVHISTLEGSVARLQTEINDRDQELMLNEVELSGIPEERGENPTHIALACATKLGVSLDERDIVGCARVGGPRQEPGARPRPLAVRLARRDVRDDLLRAARVRRRMSTEGLGLKTAPCTFFINERLTRTNRALFYQARKAGERNRWRYVWTREGRIYARRDTGAPAHRVRCETDIKKVFGFDGVRSPSSKGGVF